MIISTTAETGDVNAIVIIAIIAILLLVLKYRDWFETYEIKRCEKHGKKRLDYSHCPYCASELTTEIEEAQVFEISNRVVSEQNKGD